MLCHPGGYDTQARNRRGLRAVSRVEKGVMGFVWKFCCLQIIGGGM